MNKEDVQEWIDAWDRMERWRYIHGAGHVNDFVWFYSDSNYDNLKKYLIEALSGPPSFHYASRAWEKKAVDLAREMVKMPDEQWDLLKLSGFKYNERKHHRI